MTADRAPHSVDPAPVVDRAEEAADLTRRGRDVVLMVAPDAAAVSYPTNGPGRLAIMIGRIDDPVVMAAAREMAAELF